MLTNHAKMNLFYCDSIIVLSRNKSMFNVQQQKYVQLWLSNGCSDIKHLNGPFQWLQSLFRCRMATLNFSMRFYNIISPYMDCVTHKWNSPSVFWAFSYAIEAPYVDSLLKCWVFPEYYSKLNLQGIHIPKTPIKLHCVVIHPNQSGNAH